MQIDKKSLFRCSKMYALLALGFVFVGRVGAQSTFGAILGHVTDASGAIIRGAHIVAENQGTGEARETASDDAGDYVFLNVDPGQYTIKASASQFSEFEDTGVVVLARETARADIKLGVKGANETVEVVGGQSLLSEDLTTSTSRSGQDIGTLALNFRATNSPSPIQAAAITPTVNQDPGGNLTFAGQLPTATSFSVDGISIQNVRYGGPSTNLLPSVEGISEFRVNTAGNSVEFAQPTDLTVVTKSGTNTYHGSGFWYFTNKDWNSQDTIGNFNPTLTANTFGTSVDGPILKDKLFFYFDYEGVRLDQNTLIATQTMPGAWASGNFTGVTGLKLYSPNCIVSSGAAKGTVVSGCSSLPNNQLIVNATSAAVMKDFFPAPVGPYATESNIDSTGHNNLSEAWPGIYSANGYDGRIDHNFSEKHHIFGRITQHNITSTGSDATTAGALGAVGDTSYNPLMGIFTTTYDAANIAVSYNWIIRNNLMNELRGGYTRYDQSYAFPQALQGDSIIKALGITGLPGSPVNGLGGVPVFYVGNLLGGQTNQYGHPRNTKNGIWEVDDTLSWSHDKWNLKAGGGFRRMNYLDNITFEVGDEYGDYDVFGDQVCPSAETNTYPEACAAAQLVQGYLDEGDQAKNGPDGKPFGYHYDSFAQAEYKPLPNLAITFGVRDELNIPFQDATNQLGNFDYRTGSATYGKLVYDPNEKLNAAWVNAVGGQSQFVLNNLVGLPYALRWTDKTNVQPRFGLSLSPTKNSVVHLSAGMYSVPVLGAVLYSELGVDTSYFASNTVTTFGAMNWSNVFSNLTTAAAGYRRANQWDLKDPRVVQWNASYEQNIGFKTVARAAYVGSHTWDLIYSPDLNQVPANHLGYAAYRAAYGANFNNFREVLTRANGPTDTYDALILEANRRLSDNFTFTNAYTYTHNKTNALGAVPSGSIPVGGQGDNGPNWLNNFDLSSATGNAFYDPQNKFLSTIVYQIPVGRGKTVMSNISRALDVAVGGWSASSILLYHSGFWLTPYFSSSAADPSGTAPQTRSVKQQNPDCVAGQSGYLPNPSINTYFNAKAYSVPANNIGRFGNCGVGILQGPGTTTFSTSFGKTFHVTERLGVHYEAQFANLFNVNNWGIPNMNVGSSSFGQITNQQDGTPGSQAGPRSIQMSLRISY